MRLKSYGLNLEAKSLKVLAYKVNKMYNSSFFYF